MGDVAAVDVPEGIFALEPTMVARDVAAFFQSRLAFSDGDALVGNNCSHAIDGVTLHAVENDVTYAQWGAVIVKSEVVDAQLVGFIFVLNDVDGGILSVAYVVY